MFEALPPSDHVVASMVVESKPPPAEHPAAATEITPLLSVCKHLVPLPAIADEVTSPILKSPAMLKFPELKTGIWLPVGVCDGVNPPTVPEFIA